MARVHVSHGIDDLRADLAEIPVKAIPLLSNAVRSNTQQGNTVARGIARASSGLHGKNAYKRLTAEMVTPYVGEYGWTGDADRIVGAGFRNGAVNTDLEQSLDIQGPQFAKDVGDVVDGLFW